MQVDYTMDSFTDSLDREYKKVDSVPELKVSLYRATDASGVHWFTLVKGSKQVWNKYATMDSSADRFQADALDVYKSRAKDRAETKAANAAAVAEKGKIHDLEVGDILYSTWGYEQTNVDFYQVTALKGTSSVEIREIAAKVDKDVAMDVAEVVPVKDQFIGDPTTKRVNKWGMIRLSSYSSASKWNGKPVTRTSYY